MTAHIDVTVDGITARHHSAGVVSLYRGAQWIGNCEWDGLTLQPVSKMLALGDLDAVTMHALAGALSVAPMAEWTIRCPDWAGVRCFVNGDTAGVEYEKLANHAAKHGGNYTLLHRGVRVQSISRRAEND